MKLLGAIQLEDGEGLHLHECKMADLVLTKNGDVVKNRYGPTAPQWTQTPPTESGLYWIWPGDPDGAPFPVNVMWSGTSGKCFLPMGQWGWTDAQDVDSEDLAGSWWMPLHEPLPPTEEGGGR